MHFLLCSDGTWEADQAARFSASLAAAVRARLTLMGVAEDPGAEPALQEALQHGRQALLDLSGVRAEVLLRSGEPTREILARTLLGNYDLVVIGARRKGGSGPYWRSARAYEIIKAIAPPVLVVMGRREKLARILICAGGKRYIDKAIDLTAALGGPLKATATLLHVIPEAESYRAGPDQLRGETERLLAGSTELGRVLHDQRHRLRQAGVSTEVRLRRGIVLNEVAEELREGNYDLVVTGVSPARGPLRAYVMGELTREIVNRVGCPVLVVRSQPVAAVPVARGSWVRRLWARLAPRAGEERAANLES